MSQQHFTYQLIRTLAQFGAMALLVLMTFISVEKGLCDWDNMDQEQLELSEKADTDSEKEDNSEEDSDDFVHHEDELQVHGSNIAAASFHDSFGQLYFRADVFTPPPEA